LSIPGNIESKAVEEFVWMQVYRYAADSIPKHGPLAIRHWKLIINMANVVHSRSSHAHTHLKILQRRDYMRPVGGRASVMASKKRTNECDTGNDTRLGKWNVRCAIMDHKMLLCTSNCRCLSGVRQLAWKTIAFANDLMQQEVERP
jgi:hypothetical protein